VHGSELNFPSISSLVLSIKFLCQITEQAYLFRWRPFQVSIITYLSSIPFEEVARNFGLLMDVPMVASQECKAEACSVSCARICLDMYPQNCLGSCSLHSLWLQKDATGYCTIGKLLNHHLMVTNFLSLNVHCIMLPCNFLVPSCFRQMKCRTWTHAISLRTP
jgi:hypothetical protein